MSVKQFASLSFASCFISGMALAQEVNKTQTQTQAIEEVLVSGQYLYTDTINALKTPTPILDVPQSLSIVSAEDIRARGFNSIGEVINYLPGVTTSQGEGHRDAVVFRGVRSTADFYIDGVRDDVQYFRPLYNLEQIEVLRGPNALLFRTWRNRWCAQQSYEKSAAGSSRSQPRKLVPIALGKWAVKSILTL
jgi:catecholate siderophore receptor